jgi:hypothetical protein
MADDVPFLNEEKFVAAILTAGFIASGQKAGFTGATTVQNPEAAVQWYYRCWAALLQEQQRRAPQS